MQYHLEKTLQTVVSPLVSVSGSSAIHAPLLHVIAYMYVNVFTNINSTRKNVAGWSGASTLEKLNDRKKEQGPEVSLSYHDNYKPTLSVNWV